MAIARTSLGRFGIGELAERPFHQLSGGQRQLVTLARAVASEANTFVLDEPTAALDLRVAGEVLAHLKRLSRDDGSTVVFTTHDPNHALRIAEAALLMHGEREYVFGPAADVLHAASLGRLYDVAMVRGFVAGSETHDAANASAFFPAYDGLDET